MKILVIDANRRGFGPTAERADGPPSMANPKWRAVHLLATALKADLVWRSGQTKQDPLSGYDVLVFNRALPTVGQNVLWLKANPEARVVHVTNDYLVPCGELYVAARLLKREVFTIANYPMSLARFCRTTAGLTVLNLNVLLYEPERVRPETMPPGQGCVYYGACRPERADLFRKYFQGDVTVAQYAQVCRQFEALGIPGPWANRIGWRGKGLYPWHASFYVQNVEQDVVPFFSNRFYEALSYDLWTVFAEESRQTMEQSGYAIPDALVVNRPEEIAKACRYEDRDRLAGWRRQAAQEQQDVLRQIRQFVQGA